MLKVYLNNEWTAVCNDTFGDDEADSSCRQLGYTNALASHGKYYEYRYKCIICKCHIDTHVVIIVSKCVQGHM